MSSTDYEKSNLHKLKVHLQKTTTKKGKKNKLVHPHCVTYMISGKFSAQMSS